MAAPADWSQGDHAALVPIGTHSLQASISGPARAPNQPVVIFMHGLTSSMSEWPAVRRLISKKYRVLDYNRSGYGLSEPGPNSPTAEVVAQELNALLRATGIAPPYVTVGHSWGGITSQEFAVSRKAGDIGGMVFVDANGPNSFHIVPKMWEDENLKAMEKDVDSIVALDMERRTALSPEEWKAFMEEEASEGHGRQAGIEFEAAQRTEEVLARKGIYERSPPLLGHAPVAVLRGGSENDLEMQFKAGVARGNGTEEQRLALRETIDSWKEKDTRAQKEHFLLTGGKTHFIEALKSGHNVQLTEPELVFEAVDWVMQNLSSA